LRERRREEEGGRSQGRRERERKNESSLSLFVPFRPSTLWMRPIYLAEGNFLFSACQIKY
jgi:hypothetical protein